MSRQKFWQNVCKYFTEYTNVTAIHGLLYLTEKRSKTEKIFWLFVILSSLAGCLFMIGQILEKYHNNPVLVSFGTKDTAISEIPFPAVTICPESKCLEERFNYSDAYLRVLRSNNLNKSEQLKFKYVSTLCNDLEQNVFLKKSGKTLKDDFFDVVNELQPYELSTCYYMGESFGCDELFTPIITDEGICYSFNILDRKDMFRKNVLWYKNYQDVTSEPLKYDIDLGYLTPAVTTYPSRALLSGADNSLQVSFQHVQQNTDFLCNKYYQGFRVLLHNPVEIPRLSKFCFCVPLDEIVTASIEPNLIQTSDSVRKYNPEKRNCYMGYERPLKYFKIYTQQNCQFECLTNFTLNYCECVRYFMPRTEDTKICGFDSLDCVTQVDKKLKTQEMSGTASQCDCKPSCTSLSYNVETSNSRYYFKEYLDLRNISNNFEEPDKHHFSMLLVYFKVDQFLSIQRNELYGVSDFIANVGGLFGLFLGFSLISTVEIVYFLTMRIYYNLKLYASWSGVSNFT
ncbi:Pickpocket protein 28-like Protein [Tribolium castaneum]|uniref:Pickpocket protein 28-like Protein n=1 Tax=Tribolium castaneum TaxID=7070 RepID=D2A5Z0_TRICA|nr:Pickpocket protein 28-like Protein [Tribolium castaneum]